jgi:hypothetical protein
MFSKTAIITLLSATIASALPGQSSWGTGNFSGQAVESECATTYSTSYWTVETVVPVIESRTTWVPSLITSNGVATKTSLVTNELVLTTWSEDCYTTSYPVTTVVWVTTVVDTGVPVYETETCTETSVYTEAKPIIISTAVPSVEVCTEYSTSCSTASTVVASTTCTPCATPKAW